MPIINSKCRQWRDIGIYDSMNKRILICDDDEDLGEVTQLILKKAGYDVKVIRTGKGILREIEDYKPDLLLLDVMMPEMDGKAVTKNIKGNGNTKDIPILLFTALNEPGKLVAESGADGFIAKPFDVKEMLYKVESYLRPGGK